MRIATPAFCGIRITETLLQVFGFYKNMPASVSEASGSQLLQIGVGVVFTYIGLVFFLTGVNVGFMPIGYQLGISLAKLSPAVLISFGLIIGVLVVLAEPAIHILNKQVEEVTGGYVTRKAMILGLCIGVGASIALSMVRIVFDFSIVYYVIPGYFISLALSLFVPPVYTAIAFDSGGVASGPMTSEFILPLAVGACVAGKEAAAFFGITFREEKEILMLVVEKGQRDALLNALYREMGMGKKARGIAVTLPVTEVAGLVKEPEADQPPLS